MKTEKANKLLLLAGLLLAMVLIIASAPVAHAQETVTKSPSSNAGAWTNPTYAYADDTNCAFSSTNNQQHSFGGYGFNIPASATIDSVMVRLDAWGG